MNMDRRSFLKSLIAATVATQLPELSAAKAEVLTDSIANKFRHILVNGERPKWIKITEVGNNWYRLEFGCNPLKGGGFMMDFTGGDPDNPGLFVGNKEHLEEYLNEHPERVGFVNVEISPPKPPPKIYTNPASTSDEYVVSMFLKMGDKAGV